MSFRSGLNVCFGAVAFLMALVAFAPAPMAASQPNLLLGNLTCRSSGNVGLILGSRQTMACEFKGVGGEPIQRYSATITRVGLDVGFQGPSVVAWSVFAQSTGVPPGALAGRYAGVTANASVGVGAGANALVGGSRNAFVLQPFSLQVQSGLNFAAGVAGLRLTFLP